MRADRHTQTETNTYAYTHTLIDGDTQMDTQTHEHTDTEYRHTHRRTGILMDDVPEIFSLCRECQGEHVSPSVLILGFTSITS